MRWIPVLLVAFCWAQCQLAAAEEDPYYSVISDEIDSDEYGQSRGKYGTNCTCGRTNKAAGRIVGGTIATVNEYPYMVAIGIMSRPWRFFQSCGGALITPKHVLTAAHCVFGENKPIYIRVGEHDLESESESAYTQTHLVSEAIPHEKYDPVTVINDIALLVVVEPVILNEAVGLICMPVRFLPHPKANLKVTGWGDLAYNGPAGTKLGKVWLRYVSLDQCRRALRKPLRETQFCSYAFRKDSCQGDSGGPVAMVDPETNMYTLVGVVSYGIGCATTRPGVNTNVFAYTDWIQHHIKRTSLRTRRTCSKS